MLVDWVNGFKIWRHQTFLKAPLNICKRTMFVMGWKLSGKIDSQTLPISLETVSDNLLPKLATNPTYNRNTNCLGIILKTALIQELHALGGKILNYVAQIIHTMTCEYLPEFEIPSYQCHNGTENTS